MCAKLSAMTQLDSGQGVESCIEATRPLTSRPVSTLRSEFVLSTCHVTGYQVVRFNSPVASGVVSTFAQTGPPSN